MTKNIVEIKNLTKYYGKCKGIENVNLSIEEGEIFGFIGPNGAGKSTTIRSIMNLINKTGGEVYVNGKVFTKDDIDIKNIIGYLPSEINLYDDLTVKQTLDYTASFYEKDTTKRRRELVRLLKLDENKKVEDLSLGNLKKLGIVIALMHEPKLLILDEATSGLDPIIQNEFYELLLKEKQKGTTIFYSTHILNEITKICDRVGIIKDGTLIKIENTLELYKNGVTTITIISSEIDKIKKIFKISPTYEKNDIIKFMYQDSYNDLIKKLADVDIKKILIEDAKIEDIFLHYYK